MTKRFYNLKELVGADNANERYIIVAEYPKIDYTLIYRNSKYQPWVAAWGYKGDGKSWSQGHYFAELEDAMQYICDIKAERGVA